MNRSKSKRPPLVGITVTNESIPSSVRVIRGPLYLNRSKENNDVIKLLPPRHERAIDKLRGCALCVGCDLRNGNRVDWATFCHQHLLCRECAATLARKRERKFAKPLGDLLSSNPKHRVYDIVLTVRAGFDLDERLSHLQKARACMMRQAGQIRRKERFGRLQFASSVAGFFSVEFTRNKEGKWNVHVHCILVSRRKVCPELLKTEWRKLTGDSYVVSAKRIRCDDSAGRQALLYRLKYALKGSCGFQPATDAGQLARGLPPRGLNPSDRAAAYVSLKGDRARLPRLFFPFGAFRRLPNPPGRTVRRLAGFGKSGHRP